jgi:hypothetical protein
MAFQELFLALRPTRCRVTRSSHVDSYAGQGRTEHHTSRSHPPSYRMPPATSIMRSPGGARDRRPARGAVSPSAEQGPGQRDRRRRPAPATALRPSGRAWDRDAPWSCRLAGSARRPPPPSSCGTRTCEELARPPSRREAGRSHIAPSHLAQVVRYELSLADAPEQRPGHLAPQLS